MTKPAKPTPVLTSFAIELEPGETVEAGLLRALAEERKLSASLNGTHAPPTEAQLANIERIRNGTMSTTELEQLPPPSWFIDQWVPAPGTIGLYGPPGIGKSIVAIDMALSLAARRQWFGRHTTGTRVLYVAAEGSAGMGKRLKAWRKHHGVTEAQLAGVTFYPHPFQLGNAAHVDALDAYCTEAGIGVVIFDTLARCTVGLDENSARDMGTVIEHLDRIRGTNRAVVIVHHSGKNTENGMRGSSALLGALDTVIEVKGKRGAATFELIVDKQKDGALAAKMTIRLEVISLDDGTTSVVAVPADAKARTEADDLRGLDAAKLLVAIGTTQTRAQLVAMLMEEQNLSRATAQRGIRAAIESGWINDPGADGKRLAAGYVPDEDDSAPF